VFTRLLSTIVLAAFMAGCADPPGIAKPKPMNYQEESKAGEIYNKYSGKLKEVDGVVTTYLTASNNPRRVVVVVRDRKARNAVKDKFGTDLDGLKLKFKTAENDVDVDDSAPIEAVPTSGFEAGGWWGQVLGFFTSVKSNFNKQVLGQPGK
jgi:hypothetical protein